MKYDESFLFKRFARYSEYDKDYVGILFEYGYDAKELYDVLEENGLEHFGNKNLLSTMKNIMHYVSKKLYQADGNVKITILKHFSVLTINELIKLNKYKFSCWVYALYLAECFLALGMYETETMTYDNASDEIIEKAELLTLDMLLVEECVLVKELATIPENVNFVGMTPNNSEDSATNNCFVTNSKGVYYTSGFLVPMGQYAYNLQICHYDYQTKSHQLLYSSEEAIWINELRATDTYLVWLEHLMDET